MTDSPTPEPTSRSTVIAFVVVAIAIVGGLVMLVATRPAPVQITIHPPAPTSTPEPTATPGPLTVYVSGAVVQSDQTMTLPPGSRVQDAIQAAGGTTADADLDHVNPAAFLRDGDQVYVPVKSEGQTALPTTSGPVHINTATVDELTALPGIGPGLAQRIVDYRETNGPFTDIESLDAVPGIGPSLIEQIQSLIVFD